LALSPERVIIIDVRNPEEYAVGHIPNAVNIPLSELQNRYKEFEKDAIIITACGKGGGRSAQASALLKEKGFPNSSFLCGGTLGWFAYSPTPLKRQ